MRRRDPHMHTALARAWEMVCPDDQPAIAQAGSRLARVSHDHETAKLWRDLTMAMDWHCKLDAREKRGEPIAHETDRAYHEVRALLVKLGGDP